MLTKKKKIIVLVSMLILLVITGVLNVMVNSSAVTTTTASTSSYESASFFTTCRADRAQTRQESIDYYNQIIASSASSSDAKKNAETQISSILSSMSMETTMEGLIKAKGFSEALVNYSSTYINVLVKSAKLTDSEVAQIVEIIQSQVNRDIDYIKIIPVE